LSLLLRRFLEAMCHGCEDLELHERHRLERNLEWEDGCRLIYLGVLGTKVPELVRENDRLVEASGARRVSFFRYEVDV